MKSSSLAFFLFCCFVAQVAYNQTEALGVPYSWRHNFSVDFPSYEVVKVNNDEELKLNESLSLQSKDKRYTFGKEITVELDVLKQAKHFSLENGKQLYLYRIKSVNAVSLSLIFSAFYLEQGDELYLYDVSRKRYIGAHTFLNNNQNNVLGTDILYGDDIVIELVTLKQQSIKRKLTIGTIIHGFRRLDELAKDLNESGSCMYDVNCTVGDPWRDQSNAVVLIVAGGSFCSGTMLNTTSNTVVPYLLTANHCGTSNIGNWVFRFGYESPANKADCGTSAPSADGPMNQTINGAILKATNSASDFTLVQLNNTPPIAWNVFYAGWDRTGNIPRSGAGIHHPSGDVKKISIYNNPMSSSDYGTSFPNSHWKVGNWDLGVTEGGSSGSAFFDDQKRVIGQLHGGLSSCSGTKGFMEDEYGKFSRSWDGMDSSKRLKDWLDPLGVNPKFIDGKYQSDARLSLDGSLYYLKGANGTLCSDKAQPVLLISNSGSANLTSASIKYGNGSNYSNRFVWKGNLKPFGVDTIFLPQLIVSTGEGQFVAKIDSVNLSSDANNNNNFVVAKYQVLSNPVNITFVLKSDCYPEETSWRFFQTDSTKPVYYQPSYNSNTSGIKDSLQVCLSSKTCYTFSILDYFGDGMNGGSGCSLKGSFTIKDDKNIELVRLDEANANFGFRKNFTFCIKENSLKTHYDHSYSLQIYPNPASNRTTIDSPMEGKKYLKIFDAMGRLVCEEAFEENSKEIETSQYSNGTYVVVLYNDVNLIQEKLQIYR